MTRALELLRQLDAEVETLGKSRPHTFDAGLVCAQLSIKVISNTLTKKGLALTPETVQALQQLEAALEQGKPELNRAWDLFQPLRSYLVHGAHPDAIETTNFDRYLQSLIGKSNQTEPPMPSHRTRCLEDLSVRLLPPVHRERYREEWRAEVLRLPRRDQAPHALRLLSRAWFLRQELADKRPRNARSIVFIIGVAIPGVDAITALSGLDWSAAAVGIGWAFSLMWIVASKERTRRLIKLIRVARSSKSPVRSSRSIRGRDSQHQGRFRSS